MDLDQFSRYITTAIYVVIFLLVTSKALRQRSRANTDIALFFAVPTACLLISSATLSGLIPPNTLPTAVTVTLLLAIIYPLLRLVDDFSDVPRWLMLTALAGLVVLGGAVLFLSIRSNVWLSIPAMLYMVAGLLYATVAFFRQAGRSRGVTRRRMHAAGVGSLALLSIFVLVVVALALPTGTLGEAARLFYDAAILLSALSYFIAFATPSLLRRAWQEPELRSFLAHAALLPRMPDTSSIIAELEKGAATSLGAHDASIGLWDEHQAMLTYPHAKSQPQFNLDTRTITGQAFITQKTVFDPEISPNNPAYGYQVNGLPIRAVMATPITVGDRRLGVLTAYAPRAPIFAEEDMALLDLLADQAAVILESRYLIDHAARVQAREQVARLKEDFLSAAAHDLKTPLTILIAQSELLERRALRAPDAPADVDGLRKLKKESYRLKALVLEFLDAAMTDGGKLIGTQQELDLTDLAQEACAHHTSERHPCILQATSGMIGRYDSKRIQQLLENLIENAIKYSPHGGVVRVVVKNENDWNHISVADNGIGIPKEDLPNVFERFHRGTNVDDRAFAGMGLGLYICRGIVEQQGGRIWVESTQVDGGDGGNDNNHKNGASKAETSGTTFHVLLPATPAALVGVVAGSNMAAASADAR